MSRKNRKRDTCPTCCPNDKFAIYKKDRDIGDDGDFHTYWICNNCGHRKLITPRRSYIPGEINVRQQRTLDRLRTHLIPISDIDRYEWKSWDVTTTDYGTVWLSCQKGLLNDEGTMASVICRDDWHIQIKAGGAAIVHRSPNWSRAKRL